MRGRIVIVIIGCCLAANCRGCGQRPRHGLILRGDWSLECNRKPWLDGTSTTYHESSGHGEGCATGCAEAVEVGPAGPMSIDGQQASCATPFRATPCGHCGASLAANRICRGCGHHDNAVAEVGYYNHPRFHPVPTRPVFAPKTGGPIVSNGQVRPLPPPPHIELAPPTPVPEEIRAPRPQPLPTADRVTSSAGRNGSGAFSWIFSPPSRSDDSPRRVASRPEARWIRR